jgi:acyl-CoA hydrolase
MGNGRDVRAPLLVTATVDEIRLRGSLPLGASMYLKGRVIFIGSSSILVRCEVGEAGASPEGEQDSPARLVADFLYVSRDRLTGKASKVNRLFVEGPDAILFNQKFEEVWR